MSAHRRTQPSRTIRPGDWCREELRPGFLVGCPGALLGYVGKLVPLGPGDGRAFYPTRAAALSDHPGDAIGYASRDSIARCPGECRCGSRNVTMTTVYPVRGTAPGGWGRLGDPGGYGLSECGECGRKWVTT